ncbi:putative membrane protein YdjX (TVP38/TMEM64 family) [Breznakia sp. PF5-3]|uniref:TVP38/TMEM64 family protein n=1 Tax=unclassified Breznakia TaxID=2623764 RepID=UPI0024076759|nr:MULTISPECIES: VTT domain-containing protein [unclassified Breznakia]MDF9824736.1 putative membrane protein YdjX (TVP38/TMEM64 family) [Breznakia sp. PM6-1]MDF9835697.1 putative membrane protein YdjX (TVP38/TMEM64 family) [Breznakia sp. PF5-3]MDF9837746.1 putative membrane protein YdjX (TVP38/TMEM64 family) [Breznakia sp. PFB2-8]MDF9859707.1 putative membrane protein YdjX (TVP38/TMEM64 family) [Breznakia sp. PH5-24]
MKKYKPLFLSAGVFLFVLAAFCLMVYKPFMNFIENPKTLQQSLLSLGIIGQMVMILIMAVQVVLVFLPGELVEIGAGFIYGPIHGMILCLLGAALGSIIIYVCISKLGVKHLKKKVDNEQIKHIEKMKEKKNIQMIIFTIFFIPGTPKDILTYAAPFTGISLKQFLIITSVARIPSVISSTFGGSTLHTNNLTLTLSIFIVTALISVLGLWFYKNKL